MSGRIYTREYHDVQKIVAKGKARNPACEVRWVSHLAYRDDEIRELAMVLDGKPIGIARNNRRGAVYFDNPFSGVTYTLGDVVPETSSLSKIVEQLVQDAVRCRAARVAFNPKLPRNFDSTPNDARPRSHQRWWHRPFIVTETIERMDAFYAGRTDDHAEAGRKFWEEARPKFLTAWPSGIRYDVRCLDGGAWDRSTAWGAFATLDEALSCCRRGPARGQKTGDKSDG